MLMYLIDERKVNLLAKIPSRNMISRHQEHSSERADGTGNWIIDHKTYETWKNSTGSLLWLSGGGTYLLCWGLIKTDGQ